MAIPRVYGEVSAKNGSQNENHFTAYKSKRWAKANNYFL